MNIDQDIWSRKMRYLPVCVNWICLLKSIKDNRNRNIWNWVNKINKKILCMPNILEILFQNNYFVFL